MNLSNQAEPPRHWRIRLRQMRTFSELRSERPDHSVLAPLGADALAAAATNPDHSVAGRAAAASALQERGNDGAPWRLVVPSFVTAAALARGSVTFFGWGRQIRVWSGRALYLILLGLLGVAALAQARPELNLASAQSDLYFGLVGTAALGSIAVWFVASAMRRHPARIVLLRKFNEPALQAPLERAIARELRPFGHIATLSDRLLKDDAWGWLSTAMLSFVNPVAALWFVMGAPIRLVWRWFDRSRMGPVTVLNARDYRNLAKRLRDRIGLNIQVAFAPREALPVRTSDAWWRLVVRLLIDSSDAIVIDLSKVSEGTAWELDLVRDENAAARCVFIALWGKAGHAQAALQKWGFSNPCFYYAPDGEMQRRRQFRAALLEAMRATHGGAP